MKSIKLLIVFSLCIVGNSFAQHQKPTGFDKFTDSFVEKIFDPIRPQVSCKPTAFLLKVEVDAQKNVLDMQISGSADSVVKAQFEKQKKAIDTKSLTSFVKSAYANNADGVFIIPCYYSLHNYSCRVPVVEAKKLGKYTLFNNSVLTGTALLLPPLYNDERVQR